MSLKSKLSPEARLALRIATAIKPDTNSEPKGLLNQLGSNLLIPVLIGLGVGLGTNYFQAQENLKVWQAENKTEMNSKISAVRADILASFQQTITEYFSFEVETGILYSNLVMQKALKIVIPDINTDGFKNLPFFPTAEQTKESTRIWSKLESLSQSIRIYFGDKIGSEASSLLPALNAEPSNMVDIHVAVEQIQKLKASGNFNFDSLYMLMNPYLSPSPHSSQLQQRLLAIGIDMQCMIAQNTEFAPILDSTSCARSP